MHKGKYNIITTQIDACDYEYVLEQIQTSVQKKTLLVSPLASHTLVRARTDKKLAKVLGKFNMLVPDSQWIRHAMWFLYGASLPQRVYGPDLMQKICKMAEKNKYSIMLYGSTQNVLAALCSELKIKYPHLNITVCQPSVFRALTKKEEDELCRDIITKEPMILFVGLGSPLQEEFAVWIAEEMKDKQNLVIIPVGAAFDFIAKTKPQAPAWIGNLGFEWLFRLLSEPRRLWKRYMIDGTLFVFLLIKQKFFLKFV